MPPKATKKGRAKGGAADANPAAAALSEPAAAAVLEPAAAAVLETAAAALLATAAVEQAATSQKHMAAAVKPTPLKKETAKKNGVDKTGKAVADKTVRLNADGVKKALSEVKLAPQGITTTLYKSAGLTALAARVGTAVGRPASTVGESSQEGGKRIPVIGKNQKTPETTTTIEPLAAEQKKVGKGVKDANATKVAKVENEAKNDKTSKIEQVETAEKVETAEQNDPEGAKVKVAAKIRAVPAAPKKVAAAASIQAEPAAPKKAAAAASSNAETAASIKAAAASSKAAAAASSKAAAAASSLAAAAASSKAAAAASSLAVEEAADDVAQTDSSGDEEENDQVGGQDVPDEKGAVVPVDKNNNNEDASEQDESEDGEDEPGAELSEQNADADDTTLPETVAGEEDGEEEEEASEHEIDLNPAADNGSEEEAEEEEEEEEEDKVSNEDIDAVSGDEKELEDEMEEDETLHPPVVQGGEKGEEKQKGSDDDEVDEVKKSPHGIDFTSIYSRVWECVSDTSAFYWFGNRHGLTAFNVQQMLFNQKIDEEEDEFAGKTTEETVKCLEEWFLRIKKDLSRSTAKKFSKIVESFTETSSGEVVSYNECVLTYLLVNRNVEAFSARLEYLFKMRVENATVVKEVFEQIEEKDFVLSPDSVRTVTKALKERYPEDGRLVDLSRGPNNHVPVTIALLCQANEQKVDELLGELADPKTAASTERDLIEMLDEWLAKDTADEVVGIFIAKRETRNAEELEERKLKKAAKKAAQTMQSAAPAPLKVKQEDSKGKSSGKELLGASSKKSKKEKADDSDGGDSDCMEVTDGPREAKKAREGKTEGTNDKKRKRS